MPEFNEDSFTLSEVGILFGLENGSLIEWRGEYCQIVSVLPLKIVFAFDKSNGGL